MLVGTEIKMIMGEHYHYYDTTLRVTISHRNLATTTRREEEEQQQQQCWAFLSPLKPHLNILYF